VEQRRREFLVVRAARVMRTESVNHAEVTVNERAVHGFVAQYRPVDPRGDALLGEPLPINPETDRGRRIVEAHQTFARRGVRRECGRRAATVRGLNIKCGQTARLTWNLPAE